jgi:hypothetical protein
MEEILAIGAGTIDLDNLTTNIWGTENFVAANNFIFKNLKKQKINDDGIVPIMTYCSDNVTSTNHLILSEGPRSKLPLLALV